MNELPLVSIIIPIYNVEKHLVQCVESVRRQTYHNIQIILVDDGSSDRCAEICDEYKKKDERIEVIHKVNGGISDARNCGITRAKGEYIYFLDADDYINKELVNTCVQKIIECNADVVIFNYVFETEEQEPISYSNFKVGEYEFKHIKDNMNYIAEVQVKYALTGWNVWNRFYRRQLFVDYDLQFPDNKIIFAEDLAFSLMVTLFQKKVVVIKDCLYHYVKHKESVMNSMKKNPIEKFVRLCEDFEDFVYSRGYEKEFKHIRSFVFVKIIYNELRKECADYNEMLRKINELPQELKDRFKVWCCETSNRPFATVRLYRIRLWCNIRGVHFGLENRNFQTSLGYWLLRYMG